MENNKKIGVFLCRCGGNISDVVDLDHLKEYALQQPDVEFAEYQSFTCSSEGQGVIQNAISEQGIDGVVIGCCTPKQYEELYRECINETGLNPYMLEMVNLREQCSYPHHDEPEKATQKGTELLGGAINKVRLLQPLELKKVKINKDVAVIGGGIAGIHASLMLAKSGYKVSLIEKEPAIGGNMAKLVKTFPTDDCAMCTLSPKLDETAKHKNINLLANSEIHHVEKTPEGLKLQVRRKARYIDEEKCTSCGKCAEVCPVTIENTYDLGLPSLKKAAFKPYAAAAPNLFTIQKEAMAPCKTACPVNQSAQGYLALVAEKRFEEAIQVIWEDNPLPASCGRVCHHACETECTRNEIDTPVAICAVKRFCADFAMAQNLKPKMPLTVKKDERIAVIGGGPAGLGCAHKLALKGYGVIVYEAQSKPGGVLAYGIPRYRLPEHALDFDIKNIKHVGVEFKLDTAIGEDIEFDDIYHSSDAVFIASGLQQDVLLPNLPGSDLNGIFQGSDILKQARANAAEDIAGSVVVIGGGNVAVDVARTLKRLGTERITLVCLESYEEMPAIRGEILAAEKEGIDIQTQLSVTRFTGDGVRLDGIQCKRVAKIEILEDGRFSPVLEENSKIEIECGAVYIAIGQKADLSFLGSKFALKADIRGQVQTAENSTFTGIEKIYAGGDVTTGPSSVIDAVALGQQAAEEIACYLEGSPYSGKKQPYQATDADRKALAQQKQARCLPIPRRAIPEIALSDRNDFREVEGSFTEEMAVDEAKRCLQCSDCSYCRACEAVCEANAVDHFQTDIYEEIEVGAVVVATGFKEFDPSGLHYGYGKYPDVVTQLQFARMLDPAGPTNGDITRISNQKPAQKIVMVQCVGSRSGEQGIEGTHRYCSRVCCMVALKHAGLIKKLINPDAEIYICYIDIRAFGKGYEEYFEAVKEMGVKFIKGLPGTVAEDKKTGRLRVAVEDANTSTLLDIEADMVVLSSATESADNSELMRKLNIPRDESGFVKEFHQKIRPTDTMLKNIFVCGAAQGPKDIPDTIAQAGSAAASAAAYLGDGYIWLNPMIASVDDALCRACGRCEEGCEFQAIKLNPQHLRAEVEPAMCEGCGKCSVLCPTGAASLHSGTNRQVRALIDGLKAGGKP